MSGKEKILFYRILFVLIATVLTCSLFCLYTILGVSANFPAGLDPAVSVPSSEPDTAMQSIPAPDDAYEVAAMTFGGTCTPASMLGSGAIGTFPYVFRENGAASFLQRLGSLFANDDLTLVGCNAVLSDSDALETAEKDVLEWFRASSELASVFSAGQVEAVSLECPRTKDYGIDGYADTKAALESFGLLWGDSGKAIYQTLNGGVRAAVYCCTYTHNSAPGVISWTETARQNADYVVLYLTDSENSYQPDEEKIADFRSFADAGADLVIGTNGVKLQPAETYGDSVIVYSLGSLLDGATKYPETDTALVRVTMKSAYGKLVETKVELLPCRTYDETHTWTPALWDDSGEMTRVLSFLNGETERP